MSKFRVYREFSLNERRSDRENYNFSIIVSDDSADYLVNPAGYDPKENLTFLRDHLKQVLNYMEKAGEPAPEGITEWSSASRRSLGMYSQFILVEEFDTETEPLATAEKVRLREEGIIEDWMRLKLDPTDRGAPKMRSTE